jgi:hypothetical protein
VIPHYDLEAAEIIIANYQTLAILQELSVG